jgi:hypothetical protein
MRLNIMRFWIMDKDQTPQRFPLQRLFRQVIHVTGTQAEVCSVLRVRGYGRRVNELEQEVDAVDMVTVPISELDELSAGTKEWFYDLEAQIPGTDIRFGLHDSTALFVEGEPLLTESVATTFTDYRRASGM